MAWKLNYARVLYCVARGAGFVFETGARPACYSEIAMMRCHATGHDFIATKIRMGTTMTKKNAVLISIGDQTHHHDQSMYPVSFNATKTIVSMPTKPMPLDDDELDFSLMTFSRKQPAISPKGKLRDLRQATPSGFEKSCRPPMSWSTIRMIVIPGY